jgi:hypothetical protein
MSLAAMATFSGSEGSGASGSDDFTEQKPQFRVHFDPSIMKAAVGFEKHAPILGHRASSQTVERPKLRNSRFVS